MAAGDDDTAAYEIVFAVEATSNMVNHWDAIKKQYICPIVQHFHKLSVSGNELLTSSFMNLYGLVLFFAADRTPDMLTECFPPYGNRWQFTKLLDSIEFNGGGAEHHSYIAEGLATVLQLFNDMKQQQRNKRVERFCFIISNTPPYEMPVVESFSHLGMTYQNLTENLKEVGVKLSIICPHLIKELKQLYLLANDNPSPLMNYAQDKRHLVLISGFHLSLEKEPWQLTDNATSDTITTIKTEVAVPMDVTPANEDIVPQSIANNVTIKPEISSSPAQPSATPSVFPTTAATPNPPVSVPTIQTPPLPSQNAFPKVPISQPNQPIKPEPMVEQPIVPSASVQRPSVPGFPPTQIPDSKPIIPSQFESARSEAQKIVEYASQHTGSNIPPNPQPQTHEPNFRVIWSGILEWSEKRKHPLPGGKITQNVSCQISQNVIPNQRDVINASSWSSKLTVQLIPVAVITKSQNLHAYLKANKQVILNFQSQHVAQMANLFSQRAVHGLIQHLSPGDDKLIFFFLKKRNDVTTFVGILPDDPQGFLSTLRQVIQRTYAPQRPIQTLGIPQQGADSNIPNNAGQHVSQQGTDQNSVSSGMQQFRASQPRLQYSVQGGMSNQDFAGTSSQPQQPQRINQPVSNMPSTMNMPISQPHINIRTQTGQTMMRPQIGNNRGSLASTDNSGQQLRANIGGQRLTIHQNIPRASMIRMPQINNIGGNIAGNRPISQNASQLRNLLGPGNNVMQSNNMNMHQQDNSGLRPNVPNNMQQQNFIRGNNLMPGMQNQRNFGV